MPSKYCPKCKRIVSVGGTIPRYCAWGCGSLEHLPVLPNYTTYEEWQEIQKDIKAGKYDYSEPIKTDSKGQIKLF